MVLLDVLGYVNSTKKMDTLILILLVPTHIFSEHLFDTLSPVSDDTHELGVNYIFSQPMHEPLTIFETLILN